MGGCHGADFFSSLYNAFNIWGQTWLNMVKYRSVKNNTGCELRISCYIQLYQAGMWWCWYFSSLNNVFNIWGQTWLNMPKYISMKRNPGCELRLICYIELYLVRVQMFFISTVPPVFVDKRPWTCPNIYIVYLRQGTKGVNWDLAVTLSCIKMAYAVFTKIIGHNGHFRWLGPNVWRVTDFINLNRIYKAHQTNAWWTMKVFWLHCMWRCWYFSSLNYAFEDKYIAEHA